MYIYILEGFIYTFIYKKGLQVHLYTRRVNIYIYILEGFIYIFIY